MSNGTAQPPRPRRRLIGDVSISSGSDAGKMIAIADNTVIGRDGADVVLSDASGELSRRHARFSLRDGVPVIEDLDSTNGTYVNDQRLTAPQRLATGDRIRLGGTTLEFSAAPELEDVRDLQATRARPVPGELTSARPIPSDLTQARPVPGGRTAARPVPSEQTQTRAIPTEQTRARPIPSQQTQARPTADARSIPQTPPPEVPSAPRPPTYAAPAADGELTILDGPGAGTGAPVIASATIGREPECDLQLLDAEVSRRHAKVTIRDGVATIDDLHSTNGTYVNGERILETYTLAPQDRIQIGEAKIELTSPVFEGTAPHRQPFQLTHINEVLTRSPELLASGSRKWWTLAVVLTSTFMLLLDVTIVGVALPTIATSLHASFSEIQWVVDGYTIMLTAALLTAGSMADIFGRKQILRIGLVIFTISSVLCAQAPNMTVLDLSRGLQGLGGALMFSCSLALIVQEFPANERAIAFGAYGATNGVSVALGPILGGILLQTFGWAAIFYINVPIGIAAFFLLQRKVVNLRGPETKIDWPGLVLFSSAMFLAIFATIRGNEQGWTSPLILGCYAASVALFAMFVPAELRRKFPMFEVRLFKNPTFVGSSVSAFTICFSVLALIFFVTTWFQSILGYSAVATGVRMLVFTGVALAVGPLAGKMTETVDPRIVLTLSLGLAAVGSLIMTGVNPRSSWTDLVPGLILAGAGLGLVGPTLASTAVGVVPPWRGGMAGGINSTCREGGTTVGLAVCGALLQHQVTLHVTHALAGGPLAGSTKAIASAISAGATQTLVQGINPAYRPEVLRVAREGYTAGLSASFTLAFIVAAAGAVVAFALVRKRHIREGAVGGH